MFSIDQNSHSLWDALPKCQALAAAGHRVRHFVEDIDAAFTALGSEVGSPSGSLRLVRERYHRSGGADWGAAMFYSQFLGRQATDIRHWERPLGMRLDAAARKLDTSLEALYEAYSPGDNWQLIGASYVGDHLHHRIIADLGVAETGQHLRRMLDLARQDVEAAFPAPASRQRTREWFDREQALVESLLTRHSQGRLPELYRDWMRAHVGESVELGLTTDLFALRDDLPGRELLKIFLRDYAAAAGAYNDALATSGIALRPLKTAEGELPFFAVLEFQGHLVRSACHLEGGALRIASNVIPLESPGILPLEALVRAGVKALTGKAMLLTMQVRLGSHAQPLALPFHGSYYMPATHEFTAGLLQAGLLAAPPEPIIRVRFHLLDRLRELDTSIHLPPHLAQAMGQAELPARELGENWRDVAGAAQARLDALARDGLAAWQRERFAELCSALADLDHRRRELAKTDSKGKPIQAMSRQYKLLDAELLDRSLRQIDQDTQVSQLEYWDSRGAILPWCVALGGEDFYQSVIRRASIYPEQPWQAAGCHASLPLRDA